MNLTGGDGSLMSLYLPCPPPSLVKRLLVALRGVPSAGECRKEGDRAEERLGWGLRGGIADCRSQGGRARLADYWPVNESLFPGRLSCLTKADLVYTL